MHPLASLFNPPNLKVMYFGFENVSLLLFQSVEMPLFEYAVRNRGTAEVLEVTMCTSEGLSGTYMCTNVSKCALFLKG